jgi:hypothetical protein
MANIRNFVFDLLKNDTVLNQLGLNEGVMYNSNDADTPNVRPFMVLRWGATAAGMDVVKQRTLQVWVHDQPSDYTVIDSALERVRDVFANVVGNDIGDTIKWVLQIDWALESDDLADDVQNTVARYAEFTVVGSAV